MKKLIGLALACALLLAGCAPRGGGEQSEELGDNSIRPLELTEEEAALLNLVGNGLGLGSAYGVYQLAVGETVTGCSIEVLSWVDGGWQATGGGSVGTSGSSDALRLGVVLGDGDVRINWQDGSGQYSITAAVSSMDRSGAGLTWAWLEEDCLPYETESSESRKELRKRLVILSLTVVALSVISTFYDTQMMRLNVQTNYQEFNYYSWPRLFIIAGYVLIGFLGDIKRQKYVPIATLCVAMFAVFNPILFGELEDYHFNMCLFYTCLGANVAYFNLMFWNIAQQTKLPELWAGMGRVISGLADCVMAAACIADLPLNVIIGIDILMFVVLVISLAAGGYLLVGTKTDPKQAPCPAMTQEQRLKLYAEYCSLTPRETEVLEKLLTTEDGVQEIADSLYISRRMLQRYIASIYEKTGTGSRIGLFRRYTGFMTKE